ncbi:PAX-interacting protein 1 [Electrophorus electricus]|uniref:PAX-interacting protein 1 n=1 Tax=Electrophorus electricus TaxID=8005 RepID=A0A4W4DQT9_ELEEL|nr:PAX-interacting protein 1 [Electrophorus electricus]
MSEEELKVPDELFKDVKFYIVGDIEQKVVQLLKAGKGKEVSYNALATHIIAEDGDNPEVGESREVFDLPVVKPSWVILSVRCGDLLPVTGFSPESGQLFFGVRACLPHLAEDLSALWAFVTFYGGDCQLNFNKKCTHLVVPEPKGTKYECALRHSSIKIVTPEWILDSVKEKNRKDEALYHPRLTYHKEEEEEEEGSEDERSSRSEGSYSDRRSPRSRRSSPASSRETSPARRRRSPSPKPERRPELMFDDSDDSSPEKEERNLNWTPADVPQPSTAKLRLQPAKDTGLINLCANVPPVPGGGGPPDARLGGGGPGAPLGAERPEMMGGWNTVARPLRNITNSGEPQQVNRPPNVTHILHSLSTPSKGVEQPGAPAQAGMPSQLLFNPVKPPQQQQQQQPQQPPQPLSAEAQPQLLHQQQQQQQAHPIPPQPPPQQQPPQQQHAPQMLQQHPMMHLQPQGMQMHHQQQQQQQQQGFSQMPQQSHQFLSQHMPQQMYPQQPQQQQPPPHPPFLQQPLRPQQILRSPLQQHALQQQLLQQHRLQLQMQNQQQLHQQHLQQQQHFLQQQMQGQQHMQQLQVQQQQPQQMQGQQPLQHPNPQHPPQTLLQAPVQPPQLQQQQLFGHEPSQEIPDDGFLVGCVFAIADYPEQMADKQLLATWKRIIQTYGGSVDSALNRCTHLLCESQVSSMYLQALREGKRCVTAHWLNTVLKKKKMVPPHRTLHLPFSFPPGAKPCSQHIISVTGFLDSDRDDLKLMAYLAGARYTGYLCRSNTVLICKEPSGLKFEKAKEWRIPCVNAQWLCDILLGNFEALRQVQHSRYSQFNLTEPLAPNPHLVQNLLLAWRTPVKVSPEALVSLRLQQKQKQAEGASQPPAKKPKTEELPQPTKKLPAELTPYVFFTGFEPLQTQQHTKKLYELGGEVADSAQKCTHLVASKVTRTVKFLTAISVVKHIVTPEWLQESWKSQKFVDEQNYMLHDAEAEVLFDFSLEESLKRAHATPLFKGKYFYITPGICPGLGTMKAIVESAGGKLLPKQPSFRKIMEHKQNKNLPEIVLISCDNDLHLCREYFLKSIDVHNAEFILTGVLTQTLDYESYKFT